MRTFVGLFFFAFALLLLACDNSESVRVENKTDQTLVVYEDGVPTELVNAGESKEFSTLQFRGTLTYDIRYFCDSDVCDQTVLATRTITWEEITRTNGISIVIQ